MSIKRHSQMSIKQWIAMPLAIGIGVFAVNSSEGETVLEGVYRKEFIASAIEACVREAMADPKNKTIAKPIISEYCNCYANGMVDRLRRNDLVAHLQKKRTTQAEMEKSWRSIVAASKEPCLDALRKAMN
jgi:hypothetical protein